MKKTLLDKYDSQLLDFQYIDTGDKLTEFPEIQRVISAGYPFPLTVVNGTPRLAGAISTESVTEIIEDLKTKMD